MLRGRRKGKMRKVMQILGLLWNCGWWVDTWWSSTHRTSGARRIFNSSIGNMFSLGRSFRKTNLLTFSCIVLCAGNCFPAPYGKTAAGFHDTSAKDGSLASRCIFREHQLYCNFNSSFQEWNEHMQHLCVHCKNKCWELPFTVPNNSCFFFVEMFWKNLQRKSWWKNCTSIHTCTYVGDWWEGLIYLDLCFLEVVSWKKLDGFSVRCC